jgi:hypothetical protein
VRLLTRRSIGYRGPTVIFTARVAQPVADFVDAHTAPDGPSRSDIVQTALALWCIQTEAAERRNGHS